ncbi:MAG: DUF1523 domain-containing protein [Alphaproteobacteria bacterium HGW-Alphaproteobacteria-6]|nr:MAG: DUF1523 domain-containing protein [Alphaproteobacteria bacterium HGW-Alphaproteobacteria-6]
MWRKIKWGLAIAALTVVVLFLHYTLPQHDIVRITNTYNRLTTIGANWMFYAASDVGTAESGETRDIRFIEAVRPNGKVIVYRNEDTGWVWPPYFKYDSSNLQAEGTNLKSTEEAPKWVSVTHYGWRIPWFSTYPNAVAMRAVAGPDATSFPWLNTVILTLLALAVFMLRRMWLQFRERAIDPMLSDAGEAWDSVEDRADQAAGRARGLWSRLRHRLAGRPAPPRR